MGPVLFLGFCFLCIHRDSYWEQFWEILGRGGVGCMRCVEHAFLVWANSFVFLSTHLLPLLHQCVLHLGCWTQCIHDENASMWGGRRWIWEWYLLVTVDDILCLQLDIRHHLPAWCCGPVERGVLQGGRAAEYDHPLHCVWLPCLKYRVRCVILVKLKYFRECTMRNVTQGCGREANIARGKAEYYICLETICMPTCSILP